MCCKCDVVLDNLDIVYFSQEMFGLPEEKKHCIVGRPPDLYSHIHVTISIVTKFSFSPLTVGDHLVAVSTEGWSADTLATVDAEGKAAGLVEIGNIKQTSNEFHFKRKILNKITYTLPSGEC